MGLIALVHFMFDFDPITSGGIVGLLILITGFLYIALDDDLFD